MKLKRYFQQLIFLPILVMGCTYEFPEADPETLPSAGSADFSKFISVGNSLTAGYMDGALYTRGQSNSYPAILAAQFALAGGGTFNQPDVNSENGCYNASGGCTQGRLHFVYDDDGDATIVPTTGDGGAALAAYAGDKSALNNFGVPGVTIQTAQSNLTGGPSDNAYYNPYYARIASSPGTSTLIGDAAAALEDGGTFFSFWLGNNDVLGYATGGASNPALLTAEATFEAAYGAALGAMLAANTSAKGVVANIPDVTAIPYFTTVGWNAIPLDASTAAYLTSALADNYNAFLDGMGPDGYQVLSQAEVNQRKISFTASSANAILIADETLTDLSPYMTGDYAALLPYAKARQTTSNDLITLSAASVLGTNLTETAIWGVSYPLTDQYVLIPAEIEVIEDRTTAFNNIISAAVSTNSSRLAFVDAYDILNNIPSEVSGIGADGTLEPPYGLFSADGVHPNGRGAAYIANQFILAINAKFNANIPQVNPNDYPANDLP